jgi:hypothetical protein
VWLRRLDQRNEMRSGWSYAVIVLSLVRVRFEGGQGHALSID